MMEARRADFALFETAQAHTIILGLARIGFLHDFVCVGGM